MKVLISKGAFQPQGKLLDVSWPEFRNLVYEHNIALADESDDQKKRAMWFSCANYRDAYRLRENIVGKVWAIVADFDRVVDADAIESALKRWEYIAWTTWNSTPEAPRWRVVLPIEGGVEVDKFAGLVKRILSPVGDAASLDSRSYLPEQLWFFPWHKRSQHKNHAVWVHSGSWIKSGHLLTVDFTGVKLAHKPEDIGEGDRNNTLVVRLGKPDALLCKTEDELLALAMAWNEELKEPLPRKEVRDVVRKKWRWLTTNAEGVRERGAAWIRNTKPDDLPDIGVGLTSSDIRSAKQPESVVGDFLFPGATMVSAKMKEGKSFLAMQLALSVATKTPFLESDQFEGFPVREKMKTVIVAGEDTEGSISMRFLGSMAQGYLPEPDDPDDVKMVFNDALDELKQQMKGVDGTLLFELLVDKWYEQGYRLICLDPLRVVEASLGIVNYPGVVQGMNAHAKDFQTMRFYTRIAQKYDDCYILVSMHHGKNKRDKDASDPGDMIAGTTGYGAAAMTTVSLLPIPAQLEAEEDAEGNRPKRRELYIHGRHTREKRLLIEQGMATGIWRCVGEVGKEVQSVARKQYFDALIHLGAQDRFVSAEEIAKITKTKPVTVHKVLNRARRDGDEYLGWRILIKRGAKGGYRLYPGTGRKRFTT